MAGRGDDRDADARSVGGSLLRLVEPEVWHCVDVEFDASGDFAGWYVNFQEPMRRTTSGFDTVDLVLDRGWMSWRPPIGWTVPVLPEE